MKRQKMLLLVVALSVTLLFATGANARKLVMSYPTPETTPYHTSGLVLKQLVEEKTGGDIQIELYPNGVLGQDRDVCEALQMGTIDLTWTAAAPFAAFVPPYDLLSLPFLFQDLDQAQAAFALPSFKQLYDDAEKYGFKVFGVGGLSYRFPMNSIRPLETVEDFKGLKIRVQGTPLCIDTFEALGAYPASIAYNEVYAALQLGVVHGVENPLASLHDMHFHEVQDYLSQVPVMLNAAVLVMSKITWDSLTPAEQAVFNEVMPAVIAREHSANFEQDPIALQRMIDYGTKVNKPKDLSEFVRVTEPVRQKFAKDNPPWVNDIMNEIMELAQD